MVDQQSKWISEDARRCGWVVFLAHFLFILAAWTVVISK